MVLLRSYLLLIVMNYHYLYERIVLRKLFNVGKIKLKKKKKPKKKKNQMGKGNVKDLDLNLHDLVVEVHHVLEVPVHDLVVEVHHVDEVHHQKDEVHLDEGVHQDAEVLLLVDQDRHDVVHLDGEVHQVTDVGALQEREVVHVVGVILTGEHLQDVGVLLVVVVFQEKEVHHVDLLVDLLVKELLLRVIDLHHIPHVEDLQMLIVTDVLVLTLEIDDPNDPQINDVLHHEKKQEKENTLHDHGHTLVREQEGINEV